MASFSDIASLESFSISLSGNKTNGRIYSNGRHQLTVHVTFKPLNDKGENIEIDVNENKLQSNTKLINYDTLQTLSEDTYYAENNPTSSEWAFSKYKGIYDQLPLTYSNSEDSTLYTSREEKQDKSIVSLTYYVLSPAKEGTPLQPIAIAASLTLANGKVLTTADTGEGFHSYVNVTPLKPLEYYVDTSVEPDGGLSTSTRRVFSQHQEYGDRDWTYADNYHVSISHPHLQNKKMLEIFEPEFATYPNEVLDDYPVTDFISFPGGLDLSRDGTIFSAFCKGLYRSICYYWSPRNYDGMASLGSGGYHQIINKECKAGALNFSVVRFYCWPTHELNGRATFRQKYTFRDCFGNEGQVYTYPSEDLNDSYSIGYHIEFHSV